MDAKILFRTIQYIENQQETTEFQGMGIVQLGENGVQSVCFPYVNEGENVKVNFNFYNDKELTIYRESSDILHLFLSLEKRTTGYMQINEGTLSLSVELLAFSQNVANDTINVDFVYHLLLEEEVIMTNRITLLINILRTEMNER